MAILSRDRATLETVPHPPQPVPKPKIFISYSGRKKDPGVEPGERPDGEISQALFEKLEAAGFEPWRDVERLKTGSRWSDDISRALATCHGAIVLLSDISRESEYVCHEVSYLTVRKDDEGEHFPFIPIWLGSAIPDDIGEYFAAINLKRFQFGAVAYGEELPALDKIVELLEPAKKAADWPGSYKAALEQQLAADLTNLYQIEGGTLRWAAREVGWISEEQETKEEKRSDWNHEDAIARLFVRRLLAAPINQQFSAIEKLQFAGALNTPEKRRRVFERVAPFWIDERVTCQFAAHRKAEAGKRAAILNGDLPTFTPNMLVRCIASDLNISSESCVPVAREDSLGPQIFRSLCSQLDPDEMPANYAELLELLEEEEEDEKSFRCHSVIHLSEKDHLSEVTTLLEELGRAMFVILTGEGEAIVPPELKPFVLTPPFTIGKENANQANKSHHHESEAHRLYERAHKKYRKLLESS